MVVTSVAEEMVALSGGGGDGGGNGEPSKLREENIYLIGSRRFTGGKTH